MGWKRKLGGGASGKGFIRHKKGRTAQGQMPDESNSPYCLCACCVEEGEWPMAAFVDPWGNKDRPTSLRCKMEAWTIYHWLSNQSWDHCLHTVNVLMVDVTARYLEVIFSYTLPNLKPRWSNLKPTVFFLLPPDVCMGVQLSSDVHCPPNAQQLQTISE
jgi:hypothetical protein